MPSGPSSRNSTQALFAWVGGLLLALFGLWRRHWSPCRPALLPRLAAWATCAAALSLLVLPSCGNDEHRSDRNPRNGAKEITELPTSAQFYLADWQNSPVVLADAKGQVTSRTAYHPYGTVRSPAGQKTDPWSFVGNEKDEGTGLGDFHARPYRAELGSFLGPDPVATFEVEKTLEKPAGMFAYGYGEGDPVNVVDRDGRCGTPYAIPGTGCTRNVGPQLPEAAQKEVDRRMPEGWVKGAEVASYLLGVGDAVAAARAVHAAIKTRATIAVARGFWSRVAGATARMGEQQASKAASRGVATRGIESANFAQSTFREAFSAAGRKGLSRIAGQPIRTIEDLAGAVRGGLDPAKIPVNYIVRDGNPLILNTRTAVALERAGVPRSAWNAVNQTGNPLFEQLLTKQLTRNGLRSTGVPTVTSTP
jgi:RHS repeat-associated protein